MPIILSLQGCMAVGKTTALKYIEENVPYVNVSYEWDNEIMNKVKERNINKNILDDYVEIQKLWIEKEILRYEKAIKHNYTIMDFGAEEVEFSTYNYPKTINKDWNIESRLHEELDKLKGCMPYRILFLEADESTLRHHKENDDTRTRKYFEYYFDKLLPLKYKWFANKRNVDILNIDNLTITEVGPKVKEWVDKCIQQYNEESV